MKVDFTPEQMFVDISSWGDKEIGIITAGKEVPFTGHFDFVGMILKSSNSGSGVFQNIGENGIVENVKCEFTDSRLAHTSSGKIQNVQSRNAYSADIRDTGGILYLNNGTVSNATVWAEAKSDVTVLNYKFFGGISTINGGTIDSCIFYGANANSVVSNFGGIACDTAAESTEVNGVVTFRKGIFKNCRVYMPQNKSFAVEEYFGGIVSASLSGVYVENCTANVKITGLVEPELRARRNLGGISGFSDSPTVIKNSSATGSIIDEGLVAALVGGISGGIFVSSEKSCYIQISDCESGVMLKGRTDIAGIVGKIVYSGTKSASVSITNCKNRADLMAIQLVAGIVGQIEMPSFPITISKCINYGDITSTGTHSGGLVGSYTSTGGYLYDSINYGNILGTGVRNGGFAGNVNAPENIVLTIEKCVSYASVVSNTDGTTLAASFFGAGGVLKNCKVRNVDGISAYSLHNVSKPVEIGKIEYLSAAETPTEKPKPEITKTMIMEADNVIKYQLDFNTDLIPAGTKIFSYKISVDGGSYFTQLIHKEYVLCKIDTAEIASSIAIGKGAGQYSRLTFIYNAPTTESKCKVLIRLSNNREYYL